MSKVKPRKKDASHSRPETQKKNASQKKNENHSKPASVKPSVLARRILRGHLDVPKEIIEIVWFHNSLFDTEKELKKRLDRWSKSHPLRINFLSKIMGIGPILSSGLIAWLSPIDRFATISKLWAYCGLSAVHYECECDGHSKTNKKKIKHKFLISSKPTECPVRIGKDRVKCGAKVTCKFVRRPMRRRRGWLIFYNPRLKTLMWKIASSFEKQKSEKSFYRRIYEEQKNYYTNREDLLAPITDKVPGAKLHVQLMTLQFVSKRFLSDLWLFWRRMEGLPVTKPYSHDILGHSSYTPWEPDKK